MYYEILENGYLGRTAETSEGMQNYTDVEPFDEEGLYNVWIGTRWIKTMVPPDSLVEQQAESQPADSPPINT